MSLGSPVRIQQFQGTITREERLEIVSDDSDEEFSNPRSSPRARFESPTRRPVVVPDRQPYVSPLKQRRSKVVDPHQLTGVPHHGNLSSKEEFSQLISEGGVVDVRVEDLQSSMLDTQQNLRDRETLFEGSRKGGGGFHAWSVHSSIDRSRHLQPNLRHEGAHNIGAQSRKSPTSGVLSPSPNPTKQTEGKARDSGSSRRRGEDGLARYSGHTDRTRRESLQRRIVYDSSPPTSVNAASRPPHHLDDVTELNELVDQLQMALTSERESSELLRQQIEDLESLTREQQSKLAKRQEKSNGVASHSPHTPQHNRYREEVERLSTEIEKRDELLEAQAATIRLLRKERDSLVSSTDALKLKLKEAEASSLKNYQNGSQWRSRFEELSEKFANLKADLAEHLSVFDRLGVSVPFDEQLIGNLRIRHRIKELLEGDRLDCFQGYKK